MDGHSERRANLRYETKSSIVFGIFPSVGDWPANELNHSYGGISFRSNRSLKPGSTIFIRRTNCPENCPGGNACKSCRIASLATIQWSKEEKAKGENSYSVGAIYFPYGIGY